MTYSYYKKVAAKRKRASVQTSEPAPVAEPVVDTKQEPSIKPAVVKHAVVEPVKVKPVVEEPKAEEVKSKPKTRKTNTTKKSKTKSKGFKLKGYCVKCKDKTEIIEGKTEKMKNGRPAHKGKCSVCGTGMYKILSKAEAAKLGV